MDPDLKDIIMQMIGAKVDEEEQRYQNIPKAYMPLIWNHELEGFCPPQLPNFVWPLGMKIVETPHCERCNDTMEDCTCGVHLFLNYNTAINWLNYPGAVLTAHDCLSRVTVDQYGNVRARRTAIVAVYRYDDTEYNHRYQRMAHGLFNPAIDANAAHIRQSHNNVIDNWLQYSEALGVDFAQFKA